MSVTLNCSVTLISRNYSSFSERGFCVGNCTSFQEKWVLKKKNYWKIINGFDLLVFQNIYYIEKYSAYKKMYKRCTCKCVLSKT